jgi:hypothetical protein
MKDAARAKLDAVALAESSVPIVVPEAPAQSALSVAQQAAKDKLENPTVDSNGEHITTVEEAKIEA